MNSDNFNAQPTVARGNATTFDAGLRNHMVRVYNRMIGGLVTTAVVAFLILNTGAINFFISNMMITQIIMLSPLAIIFFGFNPARMSSSQLRLGFLAVAVVYGLSFSLIGAIYTGESIARAFFITGATFAGLSIFGYTTKKDLSGLGTFLFMAMWGLLLVGLTTMVFGMFGVDTSMMNMALSAVSVLVFSGLTAYETQATKEMYNAGAGDEANSLMAWASALNLYISFIAILQSLIHLFGQRN
jgi:uncharacterized protein